MPEILGKEVGSVGYGLMGLTWRLVPPPEEQSFKAMKAALNSGCNFWNAGELYGTEEYNSLHLLQRYFSKYPEDASKVVISIKGGVKNMKPDGSPENIRQSVENCLKILKGTKKIDIFEMARVDKNVPLETTLKELEKYVQAGKIGGIGLSEVNAATIRKAVAITKIVAVEVELSLRSPSVLTNGVAAACSEYEIPLVAYSPIGRGMLAQGVPEGRHIPTFQLGVYERNMELVKELQKLAKGKDCTPAQLAISWVKSLSGKDENPVIIPIPGATTEERVFENSKEVQLTSEDLTRIDFMLKNYVVASSR